MVPMSHPLATPLLLQLLRAARDTAPQQNPAAADGHSLPALQCCLPPAASPRPGSPASHRSMQCSRLGVSR
eukprot:3023794-Pleurochrysis_carterae.AAC.1